MLPLAALYLVAVICSSRWTRALPVYAEANRDPPADLIQELVSQVGDGPNTAEGERRELDNLYPLLMQHSGDRDSWSRGAKDSAQDKFANTVEDLRAAVLKLAAADRLRSQGFLRSEQSLPKTNKRACFWKYCVTN